MALDCNPEALTHLLTPILPYLCMTCVEWHGGQIWHFWHFWHKWRIWHAPYVIARYGNTGVKRCVKVSGLLSNAIKQLLNRFDGLNFQNTDFWNFPLYFFKFPLYNQIGERNVDFESRVLIFMFFNCTMVRDIHTMGKILLPYTLEILTHPTQYVA